MLACQTKSRVLTESFGFSTPNSLGFCAKHPKLTKTEKNTCSKEPAVQVKASKHSQSGFSLKLTDYYRGFSNV